MVTALKAAAGRFPAPAWILFGLLAIPGSAWGRQVTVRTVDELTAAVKAAQPKDSILLEEGTYALGGAGGFIQLDGKTDLTLASKTGRNAKTILKGKGFASMDDQDDLLRIGSSKRITIQNLGFEQCHSYGIKLEAEKNPEDIAIRGCRFHEIGTRLIKGSTRPGAVALRGEIVDCEFSNVSVPGADWDFSGDYIAAIDLMALDGWRIARNVIRDVKGRNGGGRAGIFIWVGSRNVIVERNVIVGCDRGIALGNPSPSTSGAEVHVTAGIVRNNFIVTGPDAGIELAWVKDVRVLHNSIWRTDVGGRGIRSVEKVEGALIANNLVRGRLLMLGTEFQKGNVAALEGVFKNTTAGDLHLLPGASLAIDRGVMVEGADEDYDGQRRPQGAAPDVGADEAGAPPTVSIEGGSTREAGKPSLSAGRPRQGGRDLLGRGRKSTVFFGVP